MANALLHKAPGRLRRLWTGCSLALVLLFLFMLCLIAEAAVTHLFRNTAPKAFSLFYLVLPWACLLLCALYLGKHPISPRRFALALFLLSLVAKGTVALLLQTPPESDFYLLYYAAKELAGGNNILNTTQYFQYWAYQSGFVAWMAFFIRFFHAGLPFFLVMNAVAVSATNVLLYCLCRRFASHRAAALAALIYLCYPAAYFMVPVLTNQIMAELFLTAALWMFLSPQAEGKKPYRACLGAGSLLAVSNLFRPMAVVVLLAVLGGTLLYTAASRQSLRVCACSCLLFLTGYLAVTKGASLLVCVSGLNANGLSNQLPAWKFVLGLNRTSLGQYSSLDAATVFASEDPAAAAQALLRERLSAYSVPELLRLFRDKLDMMWGSFEDSSWAFTQQVMDRLQSRGLDGFVQYWINKWCRLGVGLYTAVLAMAGLGAWAGRRKPSLSAILILAAGFYFGAHLLIEIQVRYRSTMLLFLLPLTACGIDAAAEQIPRLWASLRKQPVSLL